MKIEQIYTKCLAEATYYISSNGEAAIIDPLRETTPYINMAKEDKSRIKYIFLTHFHADFVSGHVDLAKETGATIIYGPTAKADFEFHLGKDNEIFELGNIAIKLLHTPGHTLESSSFLLYNEEGKAHCLFSGDTLFIGDVGRPDLAVTSSITKEELAGKLFDSLHNKVMTLPDDIIIYPNHGKGSACGKNMSSKTFDTLENQKKENYALNSSLSKEEFVQQVLDGLTVPPQYFPKNAVMNKQINKPFKEVVSKGLSAISVSDCQEHIKKVNPVLLDVRTPKDFMNKHIPNSTFIGLDGTFAPWVGVILENINQPIILVCPEGREEEAVTRLSRIGYDNVLGFVEGGVDAWENEGLKVDSIINLEATDIELLDDKCTFLDVRRPTEYEGNHIAETLHMPLSTISSKYSVLNKDQKYYVYCAGGYRSVIAISLLIKLGFKDLINIDGGFSKIKESQISLKNCRKGNSTCCA